MSDAHKAVFLSYAREDTDAAKRIAEALRGFGVEVWFDQAELHGGDAWDAKIRKQIRECALFVPLVSQQTEARAEGYFRREWKIAIDRTQDMGSGRTFIVPVVIDDTKETGADVPEEFMRYQWTRLPQGAPTPDFVALVKRELGLFGQRDAPVVVRIRAEIDRALALDPNLAEAHTALGHLHWLRWRTEDAVRELRHAISLNPSYATAYQFLGRRLLSDGRLDEAEAMMRRATELDPLSHRILDNYYIPLSHQGRHQEGLDVVERALALQPDSRQARMWKTLCLSELGRHDEAVALLGKIPWAGSGYESFAVTVFVGAGSPTEAERALALIPPGDRGNRVSALARLGRPQEALAVLDPATTNISDAGELLFSTRYDPIRAEPRFIKFLDTLGLTEAHARAQAWRAAHPLPKTP